MSWWGTGASPGHGFIGEPARAMAIRFGPDRYVSICTVNVAVHPVFNGKSAEHRVLGVI